MLGEAIDLLGKSVMAVEGRVDCLNADTNVADLRANAGKALVHFGERLFRLVRRDHPGKNGVPSLDDRLRIRIHAAKHATIRIQKPWNSLKSAEMNEAPQPTTSPQAPHGRTELAPMLKICPPFLMLMVLSSHMTSAGEKNYLETALHIDAKLQAADKRLNQAYAAARKRLDAKAFALLQKDERRFIEMLDQGIFLHFISYKLGTEPETWNELSDEIAAGRENRKSPDSHETLLSWLDAEYADRIAFLNSIVPAPASPFAGMWANSDAVLTLELQANGVLTGHLAYVAHLRHTYTFSCIATFRPTPEGIEAVTIENGSLGDGCSISGHPRFTKEGLIGTLATQKEDNGTASYFERGDTGDIFFLLSHPIKFQHSSLQK